MEDNNVYGSTLIGNIYDDLSSQFNSCETVKDVVSRGVFSLEDALTSYHVSSEDYAKYLAKAHVLELKKDIIGASTESLSYTIVIGIVTDMIKYTFSKAEEGKTNKILEDLHQFSVQIVNV